MRNDQFITYFAIPAHPLMTFKHRIFIVNFCHSLLHWFIYIALLCNFDYRLTLVLHYCILRCVAMPIDVNIQDQTHGNDDIPPPRF